MAVTGLPTRTQLAAFGAWLAEDRRREDLPFGTAWRLWSGASVPTPTLKAKDERRNLSGQELHAAVARYVQLQDRVTSPGTPTRKANGQYEPLAPIGANGGKSAAETADALGVSPRTIERTRAVLASEPAPEPAPREVAATMHPTVSRYANRVLRDAYHFTDPDEFMLVCYFHRQTRRARTLEEAIELLDGNWCDVCRLIHVH
jgi:hypothetical protein